MAHIKGQFHHTEESKKKISIRTKEEMDNPIVKEKIRLATTGRKHTKEWKINSAKRLKGNTWGFNKGHKPWNKGKHNSKISKENHYNWQGGLTPINKKIRNSIEYKLWQKACLLRDDFTCQKTGQRGGRLVVHHINNFADFPELRFAIDNGITLAKESHDEFHKIYGKHNNTREQLNEFLNEKDKNKIIGERT